MKWNKQINKNFEFNDEKIDKITEIVDIGEKIVSSYGLVLKKNIIGFCGFHTKTVFAFVVI